MTQLSCVRNRYTEIANQTGLRSTLTASPTAFSPGTTATVLSARSTRNVRSTAKFPKLFTVIVMYLQNNSDTLAISLQVTAIQHAKGTNYAVDQ